MILYSTRARVVGYPPEVATWGAEIAKVAANIVGTEITFASRVGGHQEMLWTSRVNDMAALEADLDKLQQSQQYTGMIKTAVDRGYFDPASVETAIWRTN
jgi:hypothetical protein